MEQENMRTNILPGAGPFYFEGNNVGILMFHGFGGGTCADLKYLAQELFNQKGYTIYLPLLPGFGTNPENLRNTQIKEWMEKVEEAYDYIQEKCNLIIVGGHSIGGVISFLIAKSHEINGLFAISAPIAIRGIAPILAPLIYPVVKFHKIDAEQFKKDTGGKWVGYTKIPINIVKKINKLIKDMKEILSDISCPILLFQGRFDKQIKKKSMDYIYNTLKSLDKTKIWLKHNDHTILDSQDNSVIIRELINFIDRIINNKKN
jgi:carboxylesterase